MAFEASNKRIKQNFEINFDKLLMRKIIRYKLQFFGGF